MFLTHVDYQVLIVLTNFEKRQKTILLLGDFSATFGTKILHDFTFRSLVGNISLVQKI